MAMADRILVNLRFDYSYLARGPRWIVNDDEPARLVWAYGPRPKETRRQVAPTELLTELIELDTADAAAVLSFAARNGPFFGGAFRSADEQAIEESWGDVVQGAPAEERGALVAAYPYVQDLLLDVDDGVTLEAIKAERDRLVRLGQRLRILPSAEPQLELDRAEAHRLLDTAIVPLSALFAPELELAQVEGDWVVAPVFTVRPRDGYGVFALAELALIYLMVTRSAIKQCRLPACGRLFRPQDRRKREYCSEEHKQAMSALRRQEKRTRRGEG